MMNVMFALIAKRAFSDVPQGMSSKTFLLAPLACSRPPFVKRLAYKIYSFSDLEGALAFSHSLSTFIF